MSPKQTWNLLCFLAGSCRFVCVCVCCWVGVGVENEITVRVQPDFRGCVVSTEPAPGGPVNDAAVPNVIVRSVINTFFLRVFLSFHHTSGNQELGRCQGEASGLGVSPLDLCCIHSEPFIPHSHGETVESALPSPWDTRRPRLVRLPWSLRGSVSSLTVAWAELG